MLPSLRGGRVVAAQFHPEELQLLGGGELAVVRRENARGAERAVGGQRPRVSGAESGG